MKIRIDIECDGASAPQIQTTTPASASGPGVEPAATAASGDIRDGGPAPAPPASSGYSPVMSFDTVASTKPAVVDAISAGAAPKVG